MKNKEIKNKLFKLLYKDVDNLTDKNWEYIHQYLTYEIIDEFIQNTGLPVLLPGITIEQPKVIKVPVSELLLLYDNNYRKTWI